MSNAKQIEYWNEVAGPKWVKIGDAMDARFVEITAALMDAAAARPAERVLDIGCGTGATTWPLADAVGQAGSVTGIDVSAPMLALARERLGQRRNVQFLLADAQDYDFGAQKFDLLASRFGVMFFTGPVAAFTNLRATLAPGGRLRFVCWAPLADNPQWQIPFDIAVAAVGTPTPRHPRAPGPLAFSDRDYLAGVLAEAGFSGVTITHKTLDIIGTSLEAEAEIACFIGPAGALLDEKQASPERRAAVRAQITTAIAPYAQDDGTMRLPAAVFVVEAG
jgi:SAM-dependent methyltransferase